MTVTHKVVFRPAAERDLFDLYTYIAEASGRSHAGDFIGQIEAACMGLARFPERAMKRDDLLPGLRTLTLDRRVTIAFRSSDDEVEILRVFYAGRDYEALLRDGD